MPKPISNKRIPTSFGYVWTMRRTIDGQRFGVDVGLADIWLSLDRRGCARRLRAGREALRVLAQGGKP